MAANCPEYSFKEIEPRWQRYWERERTFAAREEPGRETFYALDMFPYPSGAGLHIGHPEGYTATDILARWQRARGRNVLRPMGWDAFGLPAEQHAIATGVSPAANTQANIENFRQQIKRLGFAIDWTREINTTDPGYYKWTQWIFLNLFKRGLAYVDEKPVWWCPALGTVLANEEIVDGLSERGRHPVERRSLRQWVLRITAYADQLLEGLDGLDWPDSTKRMQREWIGRSEGAEIRFPVSGREGVFLDVYTTRPDTLFGATFMALAPEHPLALQLAADDRRKEVAAYIEAAKRKSELDRQTEREKSGVFTGSYAVNPANEREIPIYVADYVLWGYGSGAIMAVPAHDDRDYAFAKKSGIEILEVVKPPELSSQEGCYTGEGTMVNSGEYDGLESAACRQRVTRALEEAGLGRHAVNYKLRDWLFSRQRYWGEPFPILYVERADYQTLEGLPDSAFREFLPEEPVAFEKDGASWVALPLPSSQLPLELPGVESYKPAGDGESPLANAPDWVDAWVDLQTAATRPGSQPRPEGPHWARAVRETNTMPQWAGSCWYHLRYLDPKNDERLLDPDKERYWGMPDFYIGGAEHAVLHLLYARFWHRFLHDIGAVESVEPYRKLFHQGVILGEDGQKMSKSRGNVINPDTVIEQYGADALRLFEMFLGPLEAMKPWNTGGIEGVARFLRKVWREYVGKDGAPNPKIQADAKDGPEVERALHETVKKVTEDTENLRFNTAISAMMVFANQLQDASSFSRDTALTFLKLLAPYAPHLAEELWERLGEAPSIVRAPWPAFDPAKLETEQARIVFQVNGKVRGQATVAKAASEDEVAALAKADPKVASHLEGKTVRKVVYVPGRILNFVVA